MKISLLGELVITDGRGTPISLQEGSRPRRRLRHLISVLAFQDWALSTDDLKSLLWEQDGQDHSSSLSNLVHRTRTLIPAGRLVLENGPTGRRRYRLQRRPGDETDIDQFQVLVAMADQAQHAGRLEEAAQALRRAQRLWRTSPSGQALPDFPSTAKMAEHLLPLHKAHRTTIRRLADTELRLGRHSPDLARDLRGWLHDDPADEDLHALLMLTLYRMRDRRAALQAYQSAQDNLQAVANVAPGPRLERLHQQIVDNDPALLKPGPRQVDRPPVRLICGTRPTAAGVHNLMLEGKDHSAADHRLLGDITHHAGPELQHATMQARKWAMKMVAHLAQQGISQFLDLGCGYPLLGADVHDAARRHAPTARVLYVDRDPWVAVHGRALLHDGDGLAFVEADLQQVDIVLHHLRTHLDMTRPVAMLLAGTLQETGHRTNGLGTGALAAVIEQYTRPLADGSALVLTHLTGDGLAPVLRPYLDATRPDAPLPTYLRSRAQIARLYGRLEPVGPGLTEVGTWTTALPTPQGTDPARPAARVLGCLARKRGPAEPAEYRSVSHSGSRRLRRITA
ncbi:SAM-dependent methyltransferase [Spirillospora sp. NPDC050679]